MRMPVYIQERRPSEIANYAHENNFMTLLKSVVNSRKVVIVGAGDVGGSFAYALLQSGIGESIVSIDSRQELAEGQAH